MSLAHQYRPPIKPVYDSQVESSGGSGITATLPGATGLTTYLTRVLITCPNPAAIVSGLVTITGPATTLNYWLVETVTAGGFVPDKFDEPIPASAPNTAIVVTIPVISGGARVAVNIFGFQAGSPVAQN